MTGKVSWPHRLPSALSCLVYPSHRNHIDRRVGLPQSVRGGNGIRHLIGEVGVGRSTSIGLDGSRSSHIGKLTFLFGTKQRGAHYPKMISRLVLGIGLRQPTATTFRAGSSTGGTKDRGRVEQFHPEGTDICREDYETTAGRTIIPLQMPSRRTRSMPWRSISSALSSNRSNSS